MTHPCPIGECGGELPQSILMCRLHWRRVPLKLKRAVYRAWNDGIISKDYMQVRQDAIDSVSDRAKA